MRIDIGAGRPREQERDLAPRGQGHLAAADYTIDVGKSSVGLSIAVMGVSKVKGAFPDYDITLHAGQARDLSQASVTAVIRMASVQTGKPDWDAKLRSADWFDTTRFPEIRFRSRRVRTAGDHWEATGPITRHGVTRDIVLPFSIKGRFEDPGADPVQRSMPRSCWTGASSGWSGRTTARPGSSATR